MGILRRLSLVFKGYITATSDRIDRIAAEEELREAKSRREAAREVAGVGGSRAAAPPTPPAPQPRAMPEKLASDYRLLGLAADAGLEEVEATWRNLASRADPKRFPAGSLEERRAAEILRSLNEAYARIREHINPTEGRFGQLEL